MADPSLATAANAPSSTNLSGLGSGALGVYSGLNRGGAYGDASAASSAAKLAGASGVFDKSTSGMLKGYGAGAGNVLGIYSGLKQGGVAGYGGAAVNAAQLGSSLGAFGSASGAVGGVAGAAAIPLALISEVKNWQSGKTGQDALGGAATGAVIGTAIMPGIGTAIGAVGGALAGAISSLFGNGAVDPENANFTHYTDAFNKAPANLKQQVAASVKNPYVALAGYFDLRQNQMKGSNPIYQKYGRMGEKKFTDDLVAKVNQGKAAGVKDPTQMWAKVVQPWINSMGQWQDVNKGAMVGLLQNMTGQITAGTYQQNFKATGGDSPFGKAPQAINPVTRQAQPGSLRGLPVAATPGMRPMLR